MAKHLEKKGRGGDRLGAGEEKPIKIIRSSSLRVFVEKQNVPLTEVLTLSSHPVPGQKLGSPTCFNEFLTVPTGQGSASPGNPERTPLAWALGMMPTHHASPWS